MTAASNHARRFAAYAGLVALVLPACSGGQPIAEIAAPRASNTAVATATGQSNDTAAQRSAEVDLAPAPALSKPVHRTAAGRPRTRWHAPARRQQRLTDFVARLNRSRSWPVVANNLAWVLATHPDVRIRDPQAAIELAHMAGSAGPDAPVRYRDTLAAAYAAAGRFDDAVETSRSALRRSARTGNEADGLRQRLLLYESQQPHYEEPHVTAESGNPAVGKDFNAESRRFLLLAGLLHARGSDGAAIESCRQALRCDAHDAAVHLMLGRLALKYGGNNAAAHHFHRALAPGGQDNPTAIHGLALAQKRLGNPAQAIELYRRLLRTGSSSPRAANNLVWLVATSDEVPAGFVQAAIRLAEELASSTGDEDPQYLDTLAAAYAQGGRFEEAVAALDRAVETLASATPSPATHDRLAAFRLRRELYASGAPFRSTADARLQLGYRALAHGEHDLAVEHLTAARRDRPGDAELLYALGVARRRQGRLFDSAELMAQAVRLSPGWSEAVNNVAWVLATHENPELRNAAQAVRMAQQLCNSTENRNPRYLDTLAAAYAASDRFDEAVRAVDRAIALVSTPPTKTDTTTQRERAGFQLRRALYRAGRMFHNEHQAHVDLGEIHLAAGDNAGAVGHLRAALRLQADDAEAMFHLAVALRRQGQPREAVRWLKDALDVRPDWPQAVNNLAWLLATHPDLQAAGRNDAVTVALRACHAGQKDDPTPLDTLAAAYAAAGRFDEALATIDQALALLPSGTRDRRRVAMLHRKQLYESGKPYRDGESSAR